MYHSSVGNVDEIKNTIYKNLAKGPDESPLRIVLATIALGMGADLQHVLQVIHIGPTKYMEAYIQQVGRAGRSGDECTAVLYFNNSDLGHQGVTQSVKDYCRNDSKCRKNFINVYFGFNRNDTDSACKKCDVCNPDLKAKWQFVAPLTPDKLAIVRNAIYMYVQIVGLRNITEIHVEKLVFNAGFYVQHSSIIEDFSLDESTATALSRIICQSINEPQS